MQAHDKYMHRCIELARLGLGSVSPNPLVGSVIVCDGMIIGEGYHQRYGEAHAEVNAVKDVLRQHPDARELLKRSTMYVSLEPCVHFGKTPPCADLIIRQEIPHVVVGCRDPFAQVNGKGIEKLREAGIRVTTGILEQECLAVNRRFFTRVQKQRPYIILKWAQTSDHYFAPAAGQRWITSDPARKLVHKWRSEEDAVLVGKNTVLTDNPRLNVRDWQGRNPVRIVIDRNLELPHDLNVFDHSQPTIVFNALKTAMDGNIKFLELEDFDHYLPQLIAYQLYIMDVQSIIVEGGAQTLGLFIRAGLWDEARVFTGPVSWGEGIPAPALGIMPEKTISVADDRLEIYYNTHQ
ncbi:MAG TPA: bifunctional diaminohydroxyphosphoribosylaminopyrimidine deaminase/5-amino-6-(5-phosphoribosylamino)uracil reductase RibD [Sphingobacteriaceae bacterium]